RDRLVPEAIGAATCLAVEILDLEDGVVLVKVAEQLPIGLGIERLDLTLAIDDEFEGRRLDPADADEVVAALFGGQREESGQCRAPHEVDLLSGFARRREIVIQVVEIVERLAHLALAKDENRARLIGASETSRTISAASLPISSPSRS